MVPPEVVELRRAAAAVAGLGWRGMSAESMVEAAELLVATEAMVRAAHVDMVDALERVDGTVELCGRATRSWLIEEQLLNPGEATRRLRLARLLPFAARVAAALRGGEISAEHALLIAELLPQIVDEATRAIAEAELIKLAKEHPPFVVAQLVDQVLLMLGIESSADAAHAKRYGQRGVSLKPTIAGTGSLEGTLTPEVAEKVRLALAAVGQPAGPEDTRTNRQRMHDALGEIADFALANMDLPNVNGERPRVIVTMDLDDLIRQLDGGWASLPAGVAIAPATARRLACDAEIIPAVLGANSDVLDLGRASRTFSTAIRRAAYLRDGGRCAYPGCRRRVVDCHHIIWWSAGGKTTLDNAAWLCAFHHWLVHEGGWTLRRDADGSYTWTSPVGINKTGPPPRHPQAA